MQFLCRITTLQNWPHAVIHGVEKRWIWQPFRGYDETQKKGLHHSWVVFALCAGAESFWNILFWFPKCCQTQGSKYNGFQNDAVVHALVDFDPLFHKNQGHKFYSRLWRTTDIDGISERTMEQDPLQASSYCFVDCVFVL